MIAVDGQLISAGSSGGAIIINPATPDATPTSSLAAVVVIGGTSITANSASGFVIGSQTLFPGSAITESGQIITLPPYTPSPTPPPVTNTNPVLVIGTSTITGTGSDFIIGSQTLRPGSAITVDGQVISLSPTGNAVVVNGALPTTFVTSTASLVPHEPITSLVIAGQTLTAGGQVTVGGDILSLAPSGTGIVVIGTVTIGGGERTATASATGKKKNAGERTGSGVILIGLQFSFFVLAFWLH
jgi:hypothetical protein